MAKKPLAIDLFCGLGGWTEGLLAEGFEVIGFDIERHDYGDGKRYPAQLVIQDVLTIHGSQFKDAALIVASPPCQEYSYMAMPWSRAKAIAAEYRSGKRDVKKLTALFDACFRIQREAIKAAGHFIPLVVENVRGAQPWVGRARWNFGSYYLWGDVPALMPITHKAIKNPHNKGWLPNGCNDENRMVPSQIQNSDGLKLPGNNSARRWDEREVPRLCDAYKSQGMNWSDRSKKGQDFTRVAGKQAEGIKRISEAHLSKSPAKGYSFVTEDGVKQAGIGGLRANSKGDAWFQDGAARHGSKSNARKAASAMIAKIPLPLARWIARVYKPQTL